MPVNAQKLVCWARVEDVSLRDTGRLMVVGSTPAIAGYQSTASDPAIRFDSPF
jgi:hypothetical protein